MNNPTERNLQNLGRFITEKGLNQDIESYRPFMKTQLELARRKDALAEDNELFAQESIWMDRMEPLEFAEAREAKSQGDRETFIARTLEGISRLYSDEAIIDALEKISPDYKEATKLISSYKTLMEIRDQSGADEESLAKLGSLRQQWEEELLNIQE